MTGLLIANIRHGLTGRLGRDERFAGALRIRDGLIAEMGTLTPEPGETVLDAAGCVVCPGFINTHHHLFQSVLKAVPAGLDLPLEPWLMAVPFTYWPYLDEAALRVAARIGLAELALSGTTTVADHHYIFSDRHDHDPAEVLFDEAAKLGLRFVLARGGGTRGRAFDDPTLPPPPVETLEHFLAGIERAAARFHDPSDLAMRRVAVAPTTPTFNVDAGELAEIAAAARRLGLRLHSHLSENPGYAAFTLARHGRRPVPWLADKGWLGPDVWFAHLVDLTPDEVALLAETGTAMAHCPQANARLGSASRRRTGCMRLAAPSRWRWTAPPRTRPRTWAPHSTPPSRCTGPPRGPRRCGRKRWSTGRPAAGRWRLACNAAGCWPPAWPPTSPSSTCRTPAPWACTTRRLPRS